MKTARLLLLSTILALPACGGLAQPTGTQTSIIVLAVDSVWAAIGDSVLAAMEPRVFTVRDERAYDITHVSPLDARWQEMRRFRQVLAIGTAEDGWVRPALDGAGGGEGVRQSRDVWARTQLVTSIVVPPGAAPDAALPHLRTAATAVDSAFRRGVLERMYLSQPDTALRDSLRRNHGFGILLPNIYRGLTRAENVHLFQSSTQMGGDLVRSVLVTSRPGQVTASVEELVAWRDSVAASEYRPPQTTSVGRLESRAITVNGLPAFEVQGVWDVDDPSWPMSGPFVTRMVHCPEQDRTWLIDAWIYAPGRAKYEYMIQLQTIFDTFECTAG